MNLIIFICIIGCFVEYLFFAGMGLIGESYQGEKESNIFIVYVISSFILVLIQYIISLNKFGMRKDEGYFYLFFLLIFIIQISWMLYDSSITPHSIEYLIYFFSFGVPGLLAAFILVKYNGMALFIKFSDWVFLFIIFGIIHSTIIPYTQGIINLEIGGNNYQFLSYLSALALGIIVFNTYRLNPGYRFAFFRSKMYFILAHILMVCCVVAAILGGGRGAFIVVILYITSAFLALIFKKQNGRSISFEKILKLIVIVGIGFTILSFAKNEFIDRRFNRIFAYIGSNTFIDIKRGSPERDVVYSMALKAIDQSPVIGYGPFNVWGKVTMPHNFFLEILLQFGLVFLPVFIFLCFILQRRIRKNLDMETKWILHLSILPAVLLMASGSYMANSIFWFVIGFLLMHRKTQQTLESANYLSINQHLSQCKTCDCS